MATKNATTFGPTIVAADGVTGQSYPAEMRRQLWPLCCGASILSGFKDVQKLTPEQLVNQINHTITDMVPDLQVFGYEQIKPNLTFLTLNRSQMDSTKIMDAIAKSGFVKFAEGKPYGSPQGFFIRDTTHTFETTKVL